MSGTAAALPERTALTALEEIRAGGARAWVDAALVFGGLPDEYFRWWLDPAGARARITSDYTRGIMDRLFCRVADIVAAGDVGLFVGPAPAAEPPPPKRKRVRWADDGGAGAAAASDAKRQREITAAAESMGIALLWEPVVPGPDAAAYVCRGVEDLVKLWLQLQPPLSAQPPPLLRIMLDPTGGGLGADAGDLLVAPA